MLTDVVPISVVIPTLNEAGAIVTALTPLQAWRRAGHEVIVVDGYSADSTFALAAPLTDKCITAGPGRAAQMNAGAALASGSLLLFLHADTRLPPDALRILSAFAERRRALWGRFDVTLAAPGFAFRAIETLMNLRSRLSGVATGDQAMFVSREMFEQLGGFPPIALMEDVALSKRLRRAHWPQCLRSRVQTSARRWQRNGVCTTVVLMWGLRLAYVCGVSPTRLRTVYERRRGPAS